MLDPGFLRKETPPPRGADLLFGMIFAENCMKMKNKIDWGDASPSCTHPEDPPPDVTNVVIQNARTN